MSPSSATISRVESRRRSKISSELSSLATLRPMLSRLTSPKMLVSTLPGSTMLIRPSLPLKSSFMSTRITVSSRFRSWTRVGFTSVRLYSKVMGT